ncbi:MAG: hypothetical protein L3J41_01540 [Melioribacteraceae bacterium]|nr:hypothetical protein [Melioribacteraceae bacterium]
MFKQIILFLIFGASFNIISQQNQFKTHKIILKGELTSEDIFEKDFGRFDAYELPMEEGDIIKMRLTASFFPLMIVTAPSNEYKMAFPQDNNPTVIYQQTIDESGLWYIYIAGDSLDRGEHNLEICYISKDAQEIPPNANFITLMEFFLAHSKTDFLFLKGIDCEKISGKWDVQLDSRGKYKSATIVSKNDVSVLTINFESEENLFEEMTSKLKKAFSKTWNIRVNDSENITELFEIEGLRKMTLQKEPLGIKLIISTK